MISDERLDAVAKMENHPMLFPPNHDECIEMAKELLVYRKAFNEPVAFTAMSNVNELTHGVSYMWRPGNEKPTDVALYRKPTIPEV